MVSHSTKQKRGGSRLTTRLLRQLLPAVVVVTALLFDYFDPLLHSRIQHYAFDQLQQLSPAPYDAELPLRVIAIDDESLLHNGQWPWSRDRLSELLDRLTAMGAAVVVFYVLFAEPDRSSPEQAAQNWPLPAELKNVLSQMPSNDSVFAESMAASQVVTGFPIEAKGGATLPSPKGRFISFGGDASHYLHPYTGGVANLPVIDAAAVGSGVITIPPDDDGVLRTMPLLYRVGPRLHPSLGLETLRVVAGVNNVSLHVTDEQGSGAVNGINTVQLGELIQITTRTDGAIPIHFHPYQASRYLSAHQLLSGKTDPSQISGHIVFIAATAKGLGDTIYTPLGDAVPGVEGHLQLVEQVLSGRSLTTPGWQSDLLLFVLLGIWIISSYMLSRFKPAWSVGLVVVTIAALFLLSWLLFTRQQLQLDPLFPSLAAGLLFIAIMVPRYLATEREQRWIRDAFSRYVSPNRVRYLQQHPEHLELGGEYRDCSFVMSDLEGFTRMMERYEPAVISTILNDYLDGMIKIAFEHDGTLDRIVGDAVAVIFSAPVVQADHAQRAYDCALAMDRFAEAYAEQQRAAGVALGSTRIGVHTGRVLIGNFGGNEMLDYRALGDPINTASRLETVNSQLGTRICVSGETIEQCSSVSVRPVGDLVLKGKQEAIAAYEPLAASRVGDLDAYLNSYQQMCERSEEARTAFSRLAESAPDDRLVQFHNNRLMGGESGCRVVMNRK